MGHSYRRPKKLNLKYLLREPESEFISEFIFDASQTSADEFLELQVNFSSVYAPQRLLRGLWSTTLGSRELASRSAAIEGKPLGDRRYGWEGRTTAIGPRAGWCKGLIDVWIRDTGVTEGKVFRRVSKNGARQDEGVTTDVVWYAVKRYAKRIGIDHLAAKMFVPRSSIRADIGCRESPFG